MVRRVRRTYGSISVQAEASHYPSMAASQHGGSGVGGRPDEVDPTARPEIPLLAAELPETIGRPHSGHAACP